MSDESSLRRILVALDSSPLSGAALAVAGRVAARLGAELEALFVEDINLVRLVAHPLVHTYSLTSARRQSVDGNDIEKMLAWDGAAARRAVDELVGGGVKGSFTVRRGRVAAEVLEAAAGADLVCLGWSGRPEPGRKARLGSVARSVLTLSPKSVLVLRSAPTGPTMLLWDGSPGARRAFTVAAKIANAEDGPVELLVPSGDPMRVVTLVAAAEELAGKTGILLRLRAAARLDRCLSICAADGVLVAAADSGLAVEQVPCSVVQVR